MWDKISEETNHTFNEERKNKRKRKIIKLLAVSVVITILLGVFGPVVYNAGYIPITRFMDVKKPVGDSEEINIDEHLNKHPEIRDFPFLDKLKYRVFGTNKSLNAVANGYKQKLKNEGFKILYEGIAYREEIPFHYYGYLKGFTGVGIIITSDENVTSDYETMVLYTTGNAFVYRDIFNWYKQNNDIIGDIHLLKK